MAIDPKNLAGTAVLTFDDEFSTLDLATNVTPQGTWNTTHDYAPGGYVAGTTWFVDVNEPATADIDPWTVQRGVLTITADVAPAGVDAEYTSGHLDTEGVFSQQYGYFEMRAKMPADGTNASSDSADVGGGGGAFWLLPESGAWPPELDVFESTSWGGVFTAHTAQTGEHTADSSWTNIPDLDSAFHTYGVNWEQDQITWYLDGEQVAEAPTPADMHDPMYMLLNLYTTDGGGAPGTMEVDYVRVYSALDAASTSSGGMADAAPTTGMFGEMQAAATMATSSLGPNTLSFAPTVISTAATDPAASTSSGGMADTTPTTGMFGEMQAAATMATTSLGPNTLSFAPTVISTAATDPAASTSSGGMADTAPTTGMFGEMQAAATMATTNLGPNTLSFAPTVISTAATDPAATTGLAAASDPAPMDTFNISGMKDGHKGGHWKDASGAGLAGSDPAPTDSSHFSGIKDGHKGGHWKDAFGAELTADATPATRWAPTADPANDFGHDQLWLAHHTGAHHGHYDILI